MKHISTVFVSGVILALAGCGGAAVKPGLALGSRPATEAEFAAYCQTAACRKDVHFTLKREGKPPFEYNVALFPPIVSNGVLTLLPGDHLLVEATPTATGLTDLKVVETMRDPSRTLVISFTQGDDDTGMMLSITNPFDKTLKYGADMMLLDGDERFHHTSICPVMAGLSSFEMWPQPIFQLVLGHWRFATGKDAGTCD